MVVHKTPYTTPSNVIYQQGEPDDPATHPMSSWTTTAHRRPGGLRHGDNEWDPTGQSRRSNSTTTCTRTEGTGPNLGCGPAITPLAPQVQGAHRDQRDAALEPRRHHGQSRPRLGLARARPAGAACGAATPPTSYPSPTTPPNMEKVIILLTDGNNEWYDWPGPKTTKQRHQCGRQLRRGQHRGPLGGLPGDNNARGKNTTCQYAAPTTYPGGDYSAYGRLSEGRLGTTNKGAADDVLDDRMLDICRAMKAQDIIMYTMTFGRSRLTELSGCTVVRDRGRTCTWSRRRASQPAPATSWPIADELSELRIAV